MRIKQDDAFVDGELSSQDYGPIKKGDNHEITDKFMNFVVKSLLKTNKAKKAFKKQRLMNNNRQLLHTEIEKFNPDTYVMETSPATNMNKQEHDADKNNDDHPMQLDDENNPEDMDDKVTSVKKRRRSSSNNSKPTSKESSNKKKKSIAFRMASKERQSLADEMRKEYLSQKADVLDRVPESYKSQWGQIMFCKWKKDPHRPVLVLGPYQVHPELRETWMKMFNNVSYEQQRHPVPCRWSARAATPDSRVANLPLCLRSRRKVIPKECGNIAIGTDLPMGKHSHNKNVPLS